MARIPRVRVIAALGFAALLTTGWVAAQEIALDGEPYAGPVSPAPPAQQIGDGESRAPVIDVVGRTTNVARTPGWPGVTPTGST
ncbi:MAG: hypothetical protein MUC56_10320 [Thermoanaerobaculales bacterium]|nr:hypothetical protein [Thermoanaerobaculales bacterium]